MKISFIQRCIRIANLTFMSVSIVLLFTATHIGAVTIGTTCTEPQGTCDCDGASKAVCFSGTWTGSPQADFFCAAQTCTVSPTVTTNNPITAITQNSATGGGEVTDDGGENVTARGVCWSTSANPTSPCTSDGTGTGIFPSSITGLSPSTTYYVRAYATNTIGTSYGADVTFTTSASASPPTVTTTPVITFTDTIAALGGEITNTGGENATRRGVCWSTSVNPTVADPGKLESSGSFGAESFSFGASGLTRGTTYYVRAYAENSADIAYGNQVSFTTWDIPTVLTYTPILPDDYSSIGVTGNIDDDGGDSITDKGFCWGTSADPTSPCMSWETGGSLPADFKARITGLTPGTLYYIRAYVTNSVGTGYGGNGTVTTNPTTTPALTTDSVSVYGTTTATLGGNVTATGGEAITERGVCWNTTGTPTTSDPKERETAAGDFGTGSFSFSVTGLTPGTTYYVRAYAINSNGTDYGSQVSFPTDPMTVVSIADATVAENNGTMSFTVTRSPTAGGDISVQYTTANDTAIAGSDYSSKSGNLTIPDGSSSDVITVNITDDTLDEENEIFTVTLSSPSNAVVGNAQANGTIQDDDDAPDLSITDTTVTEGNSGTGNARFTISLDPPSSKTVTVNYQTADGTATAGSDYDALGSTALTFDPGDTSKTIDVVVNGDVTDENDETFYVNLSGASNATLADAQGVAIITTDDSPPMLSIDDVGVSEGNSDSVNATFTVSLSPASSKTVTVTYGTADGTASAGADYAAIETKTLTFNPGDTSKAIHIIVNGDDVDEDDETFFVNLSDPANAAIGDAQGIGTITSDDNPPSLSIDDIAVTEGFDGTTNAAFTVTLSTPSSRTVSVTCKSLNYTAIGESDPGSIKSDFISAEETLSFSPGDTEKSFEVAIKGDDVDEDNETFFVNLSSPVNASISDLNYQGQGMIIDDDGTPTIWISDMIGDTAISEGDAGTVNASFEVSLSNPTSKTVTVTCQTADDTTTAGSDYQPLESVMLTFEPNETLRALNVFVRGDIVDETDETFFVRLSNATNGEIADDEGIGTIADDDAPPTLSIADAVADEGDTAISFVVSLSVESEKEILVDYATNSGTAMAQKNFTPISGTLTIPAGEPNGMLTVELVEDSTRVGSRGAMFFVDLNNPLNATLRDNRGVGIISGDVIPGDMDENGKIDLADAVLAVQILAGILEGEDVGISELIFILQTLVDMS